MTTGGTLIFDIPNEEIDVVNLDKLENTEAQAIDQEEQSLDDMIEEYDFAVIFKTEENDINIIMPEIEDFESLSAELKQNVAQNQFLMGFLNYALNNEDWLNEYAFSLQNKKDDMMQQLMSMMSELGITPESLKNNNNSDEIAATIDVDSKDIDFASAVEQLNKNKPKIIT